MNASLVILNHNGIELLRDCIPSVIKAVEVCGFNCEILFLDNASTDQSIDFVKTNFSQVRIIELKGNLSFTRAMNIGIKNARYQLVICLNNDIISDKNFIDPLINHFARHSELFAVAAKMLFWDKKTLNFGRAIGSFKFGFFNRKIVDSGSAVNTLYACAGGFAVSKDKFIELGGFDEDLQVYWEDLDLCYRAWKRGWRVIYEPRSIIYHKVHGTNLKKLGQAGIDALSGENYSLVVLKNIHNRYIFYKHLLFMPVLFLLVFFTGKPYFGIGMLRALLKIKLFCAKRRVEKKLAIVSDRKVLAISSE